MTTPVNGIYVLQNVVPAQIAAAPVAIKVVEMADDNGQLFTRAQVAQMAAGGSTVLGYFSIGEAEVYRDYYSSLPKSAIGPVDPSWPGNYLVAYWTPAWKAVCTSYIDQMIALGYGGAYFDVVDVSESNWAKANAPGGDASGAMVDLIQSLAAYARAKDPSFKVWVNTSGAENLATNSKFVNAIDGALEEELFYQDSGQPQAPADVRYNLNLLGKLVQAGKPVIAVEYISGADRIASVQAQAAAAGIGSYVANPNLELSGVNSAGFATLPPFQAPDQPAAGDTIIGTPGNDTLTAHSGSDTLSGLAGNDVYVVRDARTQVIEAAGGGNDTVWASVDYTLAAGAQVEMLRVQNATGLRLVGNAYSRTLLGSAGADTLIGGAGNDELNGSTGADSMQGGAGNDSYRVDHAGDQVAEAAGGGKDTVWASVDYTLAAGAQDEVLRAQNATGLRLVGNAYSRTLYGNSGADTLIGGAGNDSINGWGGNDVLTGGGGADVFSFAAASGHDVITDFMPAGAGGHDLLDVRALGVTAANFSTKVAISAAPDGSALIAIGGSTMNLQDVAPSSLAIADFRLG
jgi:cysteinyl-tRNA synthetase